ncbi:MAG TPA: ring-cleaving dioxygenase [Tepidisphaeraceae bacterium]|nr:ring-cleaving dioxygenase [Tepidisphaeraceae bacterium]
MTTPTLTGIHHVTAITADAQRNVDFYAGVLGLRLVKRTVNFDDPTSYHLYYGDGLGRPGTILTFFAWPGAYRGRVGPPQVGATALAVPAGSLGYWRQRLAAANVTVEEAGERFGEPAIAFDAPDFMRLELVAAAAAGPGEPWDRSPVPAEHQVRGVRSVALLEEGYERTADLLTRVMGFRKAAEDGNRFRYEVAAGGPGATVDVLCVPGQRHGSTGVGAVHHVAWRTPDDAQQKAWLAAVAAANLNVSPVMDRTYFHSIYFREPGGVLFEIATDPPGFTADEPAAALGEMLMLPPWVEKHRGQIEAHLEGLTLPR